MLIFVNDVRRKHTAVFPRVLLIIIPGRCPEREVNIPTISWSRKTCGCKWLVHIKPFVRMQQLAEVAEQAGPKPQRNQDFRKGV